MESIQQEIGKSALDYLDAYITENGLGVRTKAEYAGRMAQLCRYVGKEFLSISKTDADAYASYLHTRCQNGSISSHTVYSRLNTFRRLSTYIEQCGDVVSYESPFKEMKIVTPAYNGVRIQKVPSSNHLDMILENAPNEMYYLVFSLALRTSLYVSEIVALTTSHILESGDNLFVKCNVRRVSEERTIVLPDDIALLMRNYLSGLSRVDEQGHLFYNRNGNPLTIDNIEKRLRGIIKKAGIEEKFTIRDLRTRSILDMVSASIRAEAPLEDVADYVGIRDNRLRSYVKANSSIVYNAPVNLVNLKINPYNKD